ncbi:MAG: GTPase-associated system all-helical protein GASH [Gammaproteobacteria bacterium]|nr:GTPase-associated system all-helical protein GASH [Gammaproteobacteria bacterium]
MIDVARFVRIFNPDPTDDFVDKRAAAIKRLKSNFLKQRKFETVLNLSSGVLGVFKDPPVVLEDYTKIIEDEIKKKSASFVRDDRDLEMSACAMIAVMQAIQDGKKTNESWAIADILAMGVWSGASFLPKNPEPKLEDFRSQAITVARQRILDSSLETRIRHDVPDLAEFGDEESDAAIFRKSTATTIDALRYNAALDREELDMLFWILGGTSNMLKKPLASLSPEIHAIASGIELGSYLRSLPSQSHYNLCTRGIRESVPVALSGVLEALGEDRVALADSFTNETLVDEAASVLPLLNGIRAGSSKLSGSGVVRPLKEGGARALLESAVIKLRNKQSIRK